MMDEPKKLEHGKMSSVFEFWVGNLGSTEDSIQRKKHWVYMYHALFFNR